VELVSRKNDEQFARALAASAEWVKRSGWFHLMSTVRRTKGPLVGTKSADEGLGSIAPLEEAAHVRKTDEKKEGHEPHVTRTKRTYGGVRGSNLP